MSSRRIIAAALLLVLVGMCAYPPMDVRHTGYSSGPYTQVEYGWIWERNPINVPKLLTQCAIAAGLAAALAVILWPKPRPAGPPSD